MLKVTVLVSGSGTNLQSILDRIAEGELPGVKIVRVISNNAGAYALTRAKEAGIEAFVVSPKSYADRAEFNRALLTCVQESGADLVVLAGFLVAIPPEFVRAYPGRILNIHPSLIPSFCGVGYYGLHVHEAVLARGVKLTGATVHFVDEGMDSGPILLQKAVAVDPDDTPEVLQRRVMEEAEWEILPRAIGLIAQGRVEIKDGIARVLPERGEM